MVAMFSLAACGSDPAPADSDAGGATDLGSPTDSGTTPADGGDKDAGPGPVDSGTAMPDWGFRPNPNGFNFPNRGTSRAGEMPVTARLEPDAMRRFFGPTVCEGGNATGTCRLLPTVRQWMDTENDGANAGNCEGYTVLAGMMYAGLINPMTFGGANAFALPLNETVERELVFWALSQSTVDPMVAPSRSMSPREFLTHLTAEFARGRTFQGTSLGVFAPVGGHALLPYAIRRRSDTVSEVLVYDNNHPNTERFVVIDTAANTWTYRAALNASMPDAEWTGNAEQYPLAIRDIGPRLMLPHPSTAWQNRSMDGGATNRVQINTVGGGQISVVDAMNRRTEFSSEGRYVTQIPGSAVALRAPGSLNRPAPSFSVPRMTPLTVTLDGSVLSRRTPTEVLFQGQGWTLEVDDINLDPMQRDTLVLQPGQPDLLYRAGSAETPILALAYQTEQDDFLIEVRTVGMSPGQNIRLAANFATNSVRVSFDGSSTAPMFEIYIERISNQGALVFEHAGLSAGASSVMHFNFGSWSTNGTPMSLGYDDNGDGTIDRTEMLSDED